MKLNHPTWRAQVLDVIRGTRLEGFLTGKTEAPAVKIVSKDNDGKTIKTPNPAHESWLTQDQQVLSFLSPHCQTRSFQAQPQNQLQH
jgi:hypothetical protein